MPQACTSVKGASKPLTTPLTSSQLWAANYPAYGNGVMPVTEKCGSGGGDRQKGGTENSLLLPPAQKVKSREQAGK